jgi:FkbM family methyltransferase
LSPANTSICGVNDAVGCNDGDYVIDAGACWGETALEFARRVGVSGKVFAFEFVPSNLKVLEQNLSLNPDLRPIITLASSPLWDVSGEEMAFDDGGCSSKLSAVLGSSGKVRTTTIDEYVSTQRIDHIDYIKMDIEGAELAALRGAIQVLKSSRPKLAIALYHRDVDFQTIPEFIHSLDLGYRFHLGHHSINQYETILYATAR